METVTEMQLLCQISLQLTGFCVVSSVKEFITLKKPFKTRNNAKGKQATNGIQNVFSLRTRS